MTNLKAILNFLQSKNYLVKVNNEYRFSTSFYEDVKGETEVSQSSPTGNYVERYKQFIKDAEVPRKINTATGAFYANNYSLAGMKAFKAAIESGIEYNILVESTKLYYKNSTTYRKIISNYMTEGIWQSFYDAYKEGVVEESEDKRNYTIL